jgi:dipeptidyl aminopeptidase/acylaminoacyl peptidase
MEVRRVGVTPPASKAITPKVTFPPEQPKLLTRINEGVQRNFEQWRGPWLWGGISVVALIGLIYLFVQSPLPHNIAATLFQPALTSSPSPSPMPTQTIAATPNPTSTPDLTATAQDQATATTVIQPTETAIPINVPSTTIEPLELQGGPNQWRAQTSFLEWSPDGQRLASKAGIWDANRGTQMYDFVELHDSIHTHNVLVMAWSHDGAMWATGRDQTVYIWNNFSLNVIRILWAHESEVRSLAWSPDDGALATAGVDGLVKLWDTKTWETILTFEGHFGRVNFVAWSPDGQMMASAGDDNFVRVWEAATGVQSFELLHPNNVDCVVWSPDGSQLASRTDYGDVRVWDSKERKLLYNIQIAVGEKRNIVDWSPDGSKLAAGGANGQVWIWNAAISSQRYSLSLGGDITSVAWSPDGTRLAAGSERIGVGVKIWELP